MNRSITVLVALVLMTGCAGADGVVKVSSNVPADVEFDGQKVGETPITINDVKKGEHALRIASRATGEVKELKVFIPAAISVSKELEATFEEPAPATGTEKALSQEAAVGAEASASAEPAQARPMRSPPRRQKNYQARRRSIALGVTAVGVLTRSRTLTGLGLGGAIMNEVIGPTNR
jgi:hypothetical protein